MNTQINKNQILTLYQDWRNNFLTLPCFAEYYSISLLRAERIIKLGRIYWDKRAEKLKLKEGK